MGAVIFIGLVICIGIFMFAEQARQELNQSWRQISEQYGLKLSTASWKTGPKLEGHAEGFPLTVDIEKKQAGQYKTPWTRFRVDVPELDRSIEITEPGFFANLRRTFSSGGTVPVGDPVFDRRFDVKGRDAEAVRQFLHSRRRAGIERFFTTHRGAEISDGTVTWAKQGRMKKLLQLKTGISDMTEFARVLSAADTLGQPSGDGLESAAGVSGLETVAAGAPALAAGALAAVLPAAAKAQRVVESRVESLDYGGVSIPGVEAALGFEGEPAAKLARVALEKAEPVAEAAAALEAAAVKAAAVEAAAVEAAANEPDRKSDDIGVAIREPAEAESPATTGDVAEATDPLSAPDTSEPPDSTAAVEPSAAQTYAADSSPIDGIPIDELCADVFSSSTLSFEATQHFRERYEGRRVSWSGLLEQVEPYTFDFVFGGGRGVRATLMIHRVEGSMTGKGEVRAVIGLPADTNGLAERKGEEIAFSGKLAKVDGLMRRVFVAEAVLES